MKQLAKQFYGVGAVVLLLVLLVLPLRPTIVRADTLPSVSIDQIKITTDQQFVRLHNSGPAADLATYELIYFNSNNAPTKTITFTGSLGQGGYYLLNDGEVSACYKAQINSSTLGFSTTSGSLQLWHYTSPMTKMLVSSVSWIKNSKTAAPAGIQMLPAAATAFLQRQTPVPANSTEWIGVQPKSDDPCALVLASNPTTVVPDDATQVTLTAGSAPPVNTITVDPAYVAPKNTNMIAPVLNELLPNPGTPKTDTDDEFLELYNPNDVSFDLGGYKIIYGSTSPHTYTFPDGTALDPHSYTAFYSSETSVSLSNSGGQVLFTNPDGTVLSQSDPYGTAKDDQSWALVNGSWAWMAKPTPGTANNGQVIASTATNKTTTPALSSASTGGKVKAATTAKPSGSAAADLEDAAPLHPLILAGIGLAAVGYAIYEYRHDMANRIYKLRRHVRRRRTPREALPGRRAVFAGE